MNDETFLATIAAHPGQLAPRLVYADWLEEQGRCDDAEKWRNPVKPDHIGFNDGDCHWSDGVKWVWRVKADEKRYEVITGYLRLAEGLDRREAAQLAGLWLISLGNNLVELREMPQGGEWQAS